MIVIAYSKQKVSAVSLRGKWEQACKSLRPVRNHLNHSLGWWLFKINCPTHKSVPYKLRTYWKVIAQPHWSVGLLLKSIISTMSPKNAKACWIIYGNIRLLGCKVTFRVTCLSYWATLFSSQLHQYIKTSWIVPASAMPDVKEQRYGRRVDISWNQPLINFSAQISEFLKEPSSCPLSPHLPHNGQCPL